MKQGPLLRYEATEEVKPTNVGLSPTGFKQAKKLTRYFKSIPLDKVIHSGMKRTKITAAHVHANKDIPIVPCEDMREFHFGGRKKKPDFISFSRSRVNFSATSHNFFFFPSHLP